MNKSQDDKLIESIEQSKPQAPAEAPQAPQKASQPKRGYFFPNQDEERPFGGEFASLEEAIEANKQYLEQSKNKETQ